MYEETDEFGSDCGAGVGFARFGDGVCRRSWRSLWRAYVDVQPEHGGRLQGGETAEIGKVRMTLNNVYESRGNEYYTPAEGNEYVILEFTVENGGEEEVALSTMLSFSTWCDNKSCTISLEALGTATLSGKLQLDCVVAAGEKATGVLGYEVPADWQEISVKYTEEVMFGESAVFAVTREEE